MTTAVFHRDSWAMQYAKKHLKTDPGIREIYYLPTDAPEREVRLIEVNGMMAERKNDPLEPIDFGVDTGGDDAHSLLILDVTPAQWEKIQQRKLELPAGWSLEESELIARP